MTPAETKKWWERKWAEEAARLLNRNWVLGDDREEPDFVVRDNEAIFGLEVTLAFEDSALGSQSQLRQREAFNAKRLKKLSETWAASSNVILQVQVLGQLTDATEGEVLQALSDAPHPREAGQRSSSAPRNPFWDRGIRPRRF